MPTISIKHRFTNVVLYTTVVDDADPNPIRTAVERAVAADAYLAGANLADADLAGAYLARANLARANLADANLDGANLDGASLAGANLADADLAGANLADADLAGAYLARANLARANLADANLDGANLDGANLDGANLDGANLDGACNVPTGIAQTDPPKPYERKVLPRAQRLAERAREYRERNPDVPVVERLDAKILALVDGGEGKLEMATWHTCETTHCRAGWAIHLAGAAGYELEKRYDAERAGAMIYRASTGRVPHFFASNDRALEDIKRCAAEQEGEAKP
jgi:hypothetical protein